MGESCSKDERLKCSPLFSAQQVKELFKPVEQSGEWQLCLFLSRIAKPLQR